MKFFIQAITACLLLTACGKSNKSNEVPKPAPDTTQEGRTGAGPYTVVFSADHTYSNHFNMEINQSEGIVDYYITRPEVTEIEFVSTTVKMMGCDANQVTHQVFWIPDLAAPTRGYRVIPGTSFFVRAGESGTLRHLLTGLTGCRYIDFQLSLRIKPAAP